MKTPPNQKASESAAAKPAHSKPQHDPLKSWFALGNNAKNRQPQRRNRCHQRGSIDTYLAGLIAFAMLCGWLLVGAPV